MTNEMLTPAPGSAEEKAWTEVRGWYNALITAAPKPDAARPNINIGHIIRWCEGWGICTSDIESICAKHGAFTAMRPFPSPFPLPAASA